MGASSTMTDPALGLTERSFSTPHSRMNYGEGGTGTRPLVFLHGMTMRLEDMGEILIPFSQVGHCYACDLRGHGDSDWCDSYTIADYTADIAAFVEEVSGAGSVLIGYSIGGLVALCVAAQLPDLVDGVVSIEPPLILRHSAFDTLREFGQHGWLHWVHDYRHGRFTRSAAISRFLDWQPGADEADAAEAMADVESVDARAIDVLLQDRLYDGFDLASTLRSVTCPALLLHGETHRGGMSDPADIKFFRSQVAHGHASAVAGGHDIIWGEAGETVSAEIAHFLGSIGS